MITPEQIDYTIKSEAVENIFTALNQLNYKEWQTLKNIVDRRFNIINQECKFSCDKITQNCIEDLLARM